MSNTTTRSRKRKQQVDAGVYDGRYRTKIVPDKKKQAVKKRVKKINPYEDFLQLNSQGI